MLTTIMMVEIAVMMVKMAMMMVKIAMMMVRIAMMMVKIVVMLLEKETALDGYLLNSWAEKSRGPCSGKCAPGIQNVTYQVVNKTKTVLKVKIIFSA